jgi:zinc protease
MTILLKPFLSNRSPSFFQTSSQPEELEQTSHQQSNASPAGLDQFSPNSLTPQNQILSNGLHTHFLWLPQRQQSAMELALPLSPQSTGLSTLFSSLLVNGSDETRQRMERLQNHDIQLNFDSTPSQLLISARCPTSREAEMTQGVLQLLCKPSWQNPDFERLRENTARQLDDASKRPMAPLRSVMAQLLYGPEKPYSYTAAENIAQMQGQTLEGLKQLWQESLQGSPISIMMASPLPVQTQQQMLEQSIQTNDWQRNPFRTSSGQRLANISSKTSPFTGVSSATSATVHSGLLLVPNESIKRARILLRCQSPQPGEIDYPAFLLLKNILGGHTEGSFFERLRTQDGLVYSVSSSSGLPLGDKGSYNASLEVDFGKIAPSLNGLLAVTQNNARQLPNADMLETAKRRFLLSLSENAQTAWSTLDSNEPWLLRDLPPPGDAELRDAIQHVQPKDVQRVAQQIFASPSQLQIVGVAAPSKVLKEVFPGLPLAQPVE